MTDHTAAIAALRKAQVRLLEDERRETQHRTHFAEKAASANLLATKYEQERAAIGETIRALGGVPYQPPVEPKTQEAAS